MYVTKWSNYGNDHYQYTDVGGGGRKKSKNDLALKRANNSNDSKDTSQMLTKRVKADQNNIKHWTRSIGISNDQAVDVINTHDKYRFGSVRAEEYIRDHIDKTIKTTVINFYKKRAVEDDDDKDDLPPIIVFQFKLL